MCKTTSEKDNCITRKIVKNKIAIIAMFTALAMIFSYVESLIPIDFGIPGVKLGLANLIMVIMLYQWDIKSTAIVSIIRIVLTGFLFGNLFSIVYSIAGGLLSLLVMVIAKKSKCFSICGVGMFGGVMHNVGQLIVAAIVLESFSLAYYAPVLLISGLITGLLIGIVSKEMLKRIESTKIKF